MFLSLCKVIFVWCTGTMTKILFLIFVYGYYTI
jgi:hypothetical protein